MYKVFEKVWVSEPGVRIRDSLPRPPITLDELYERGWWITEIFGSIANVVSKSHCNNTTHQRYYFKCQQCFIDPKSLTPAVLKKIEEVKDRQWEKYKGIMLKPYKFGTRIKKDEP